MQTMTLTEYKKKVEAVTEAVKHGERVVLEPIEVIPDNVKDSSPIDLSKYTPAQQKAIQLGWSPEMAVMLTDVNPNAHLEPDFLPSREPDDYHDPFAD
jgi:hypothetical protein